MRLFVFLAILCVPELCACLAVHPRNPVWRLLLFAGAWCGAVWQAWLVAFLTALQTNINEGYAFSAEFQKMTGLWKPAKWGRPLPVVSFPWVWVWLACAVAVGLAALWGAVWLLRRERPGWLRYFLVACVVGELLFGTCFLHRRRYETGARRTTELFGACASEITRIQAAVPEGQALEFFRQVREEKLRFGYEHPNHRGMEEVLKELRNFPTAASHEAPGDDN